MISLFSQVFLPSTKVEVGTDELRSSVLLTLLFILSGYNKLNNITKVAEGLKNKVNFDINFDLYKLAIIIVIFIQLVCPSIILYTVYTKNKKYNKYAYYSIIALILFTILATLLYHFPPTGKNYYSFISNVALIGGLLLLTEKFK
jgi:uncharacterized membrane protein YphA (DoxX/SURF4 family)